MAGSQGPLPGQSGLGAKCMCLFGGEWDRGAHRRLWPALCSLQGQSLPVEEEEQKVRLSIQDRCHPADFRTPRLQGSGGTGQRPTVGSEGSPPAPWQAPVTSPTPQLPHRLPVEVRACQHVPVRLHASPLRPQGWTPADGWRVHQQPARYHRQWVGRLVAHVVLRVFWGNYRTQGTQRTRVGTDMPLYTCLGTVCSQHMAVCQLSSAQDKGQVEELRAIRSHLCPQPELTVRKCQVCCG